MTDLPRTILGQRGEWRGPYNGGDLAYHTWRGEPLAEHRYTAEATACLRHPDLHTRWLIEAWSRHGARRYVGRGATLGEALEDLRDTLADASTIDHQIAALPRLTEAA